MMYKSEGLHQRHWPVTGPRRKTLHAIHLNIILQFLNNKSKILFLKYINKCYSFLSLKAMLTGMPHKTSFWDLPNSSWLWNCSQLQQKQVLNTHSKKWGDTHFFPKKLVQITFYWYLYTPLTLWQLADL